jgi:putative flippase GtrA
VFNILSPSTSNFVASCISIPPSYYLNRKWAWGKSGKSHFTREILPFWIIALIGLFTSTYAVHAVVGIAKSHTHSRHIIAILSIFVNLTTYGILWILRFIILHKWLFKNKHEEQVSQNA